MVFRISQSLIQALALPAALMASPMAVIDSTDFNVGTIVEGQMPVIKHAFKVKNTGDSALIIQSVRPG